MCAGGRRIGEIGCRFVRRLAGSFRFAPGRRRRRFGRRIPHPFDLGRPRRMARGARSAPRRNQHPAVGRIRLHLCQPAAGARPRSALDAGAGATERAYLADLSTASAAAQFRCCCRSTPQAISRPGRPACPTACRCRAIRPTSARPTCSMPAPPATTRCSRSSRAPAKACRADIRQTRRGADHRLAPHLRPCRSARRQGRTGQSAGGAIPGHAALHPRRLCALRLHALRRALCGVDPVPGLDAARAPARLPRGLSRRRTFPEGAAHCRRPAVAAAPGYSVRDRGAAGGTLARLHLSPERRHRRQTPAPANKAATPTSRPIRRSVFRCANARRRPLATIRPARQDRDASPGLSLAGQFLRGAQL